MNIQSSSGALAYRGVDRARISNLGAVTTQSTFADALAAQGAKASTTQVSISDAARQVASPARTPTQGRTAMQEEDLKYAASNPQGAEQLVYNMVTIPSRILYDIRDQLLPGRGGEPLNKLASTGRIIDDAFKENFAKEATVVDAQRKAIYESEKAKGTPIDQILAKLFDHMNSQSMDYIEATGLYHMNSQSRDYIEATGGFGVVGGKAA